VCCILNSETCRLNIPGSSFQSTTNRGFVKHWGGIHLFGEMYGSIRRGCCTSCVYNAEEQAAGLFLLAFIRFRTPSSTLVHAPFFFTSFFLFLLLHLPLPLVHLVLSPSFFCSLWIRSNGSLSNQKESLKQSPHLIHPLTH
jgi:hypothetical protein